MDKSNSILTINSQKIISEIIKDKAPIVGNLTIKDITNV